MTSPRPGRQVRGSRSGRPIMATFDLLGRRWSLRVLWELRATTLTFRELQQACDGVSPTVLNTRLRELRQAGILESAERGYGLTDRGRALCRSLRPLVRWSEEWAAE